ncbi:hypothetical protein [Alkaliphilus transvaalensis]|uniref:hypothetical protein n=1 Tax=Alkaliphilus transvaalensis TaxID=114628 RepID=UPI00047B1A3D|nr:hypothetical protein [Alkaliphilus transvaalensis]
MQEIKFGDVFKIRTKAGKGYFQYVKDLPSTRCQIIRILPGVYRLGKRPALDLLVQEKELYFVHFHIFDAVRKRQVKLVDNFLIPEDLIIPRYYRTKHILQEELICWQILNIENQKSRPVMKLSNKEKKLSPADIWSSQILSERIAEGWLPENWH